MCWFFWVHKFVITWYQIEVVKTTAPAVCERRVASNFTITAPHVAVRLLTPTSSDQTMVVFCFFQTNYVLWRVWSGLHLSRFLVLTFMLGLFFNPPLHLISRGLAHVVKICKRRSLWGFEQTEYDATLLFTIKLLYKERKSVSIIAVHLRYCILIFLVQRL